LRAITLSELNLLDVGHEIQLFGAIYSGKGTIYLVPLPDEDVAELSKLEIAVDYMNENPPSTVILKMSAEELAKFFAQTDVLDIIGTRDGAKVVLRKSQRQVDQNIAWAVFRRDGFACRYCGRENVPLTVDHVDLWEDGGATLEENLVSSCRRCNKLRGRTLYQDWLLSPEYLRVSAHLDPLYKAANLNLLERLERLIALRGKVRSR
jgi:HNH endonuclease